MIRIFLFLSLVLNLCFADISEYFPPLTGRVVDDANILSQTTKQDLASMLKAEDDNSTNQVVIVTLNSLYGYSIEEFGNKLARHWGIGQKDKNNGVLLLIAPYDRKTRIEVGYGLEGLLTDKISHEIITYVMIPEFKKGDFNTGVLNATKHILAVLNGDGSFSRADKIEEEKDFSKLGIIFTFFSGFILLLLGSRFKKQKLVRAGGSLALGTFAGIFAMIKMPDTGLIVFFIFVAIFAIYAYFILFNNSGKSSGGYRSSSGFGGRSFGGGGFSGGGGSFGGGGASGSW